MTDPIQILAAAGVSVPDVEEYREATSDYNRDADRRVLNYGVSGAFHVMDSADAAIDALAREVAKWKWVAKASVAEHCIYGARTVEGVDGCEVCAAEIDRLIARYRDEEVQG